MARTKRPAADQPSQAASAEDPSAALTPFLGAGSRLREAAAWHGYDPERMQGVLTSYPDAGDDAETWARWLTAGDESFDHACIQMLQVNLWWLLLGQAPRGRVTPDEDVLAGETFMRLCQWGHSAGTTWPQQRGALPTLELWFSGLSGPEQGEPVVALVEQTSFENGGVIDAESFRVRLSTWSRSPSEVAEVIVSLGAGGYPLPARRVRAAPLQAVVGGALHPVTVVDASPLAGTHYGPGAGEATTTAQRSVVRWAGKHWPHAPLPMVPYSLLLRALQLGVLDDSQGLEMFSPPALGQRTRQHAETACTAELLTRRLTAAGHGPSTSTWPT